MGRKEGMRGKREEGGKRKERRREIKKDKERRKERGDGRKRKKKERKREETCQKLLQATRVTLAPLASDVSHGLRVHVKGSTASQIFQATLSPLPGICENLGRKNPSQIPTDACSSNSAS